MQIDMAPQDASCSAMVKQCKHESPCMFEEAGGGGSRRELISDLYVRLNPARIH